AIGLADRALSGSKIVEDEPAFVSWWKKSRADAREESRRQEQQQYAKRHRDTRAANDDPQQPLVRLLEPAMPFARGPMMGRRPARHERHHADCERKRDEDGHGERQRQRLKELAGYSRQQAERREDD